MKLKGVTLRIDQKVDLRHVPGTWQTSDFRRLLNILEVEDEYKDSEVEEVALMALQDLDHREAVEVILSNFNEGQFTTGQIQNLVEELKEECAWDEYSDLVDHRALYVCIDVMNAAFPKDYPEPSLAHLKITISADGLDSVLAKHSFDEAMLLRSLARSSGNETLLHRLFPDQLAGGSFAEAPWIVWVMKTKSTGSNTIAVDCYGSAYWFRGMEEETESSIDLVWS